jgi:acetolactate synthase-1/2/3 large subunit
VLNTVEIMHPVTKFSEQIVNAYRISPLIREAFRTSQEERPGAVHLELPEDIAKEEVDDEPIEVSRVRRPIAEEKAIRQAVDMIEKSKNPLILIGAGANRKLVSKMLNELIEKTRIPFFNTQMGKGVIDERNELFLGTAALSGDDFIHNSIEKSDLIINIGHDVVEKPPFIMNHKDTRKVIHINFYSAKVDNVYFPQLEVIGDIANALWQIKEKIKRADWDSTAFLKNKASLENYFNEKSGNNSFPIKPQSLVKIIRETLPEDSIVTLDNGMYKLWFARHFKAYLPNSLILDNALATMGAGLPSAIAAKMIYQSKKVVAITGDGGFMMNSQELETALRLKLDMTIIVLKDNSYGMIKWKQRGDDFEDFGLDFSNPDFKKYAESYGAYGYSVNSVDEFRDLLNETIVKKGVHLIEVPIDYSENIDLSKASLQKLIPA